MYAQAWQEAVHLAAVQHPNVVTVYDCGADDGGPFLIMELVEGETLEQVVARGAFPLQDFLDSRPALARRAGRRAPGRSAAPRPEAGQPDAQAWPDR